MASLLRNHGWRLGVVAVILGGVTVGIAMLRNTPSAAYPGMPREQRAYWSWVASVAHDPAAAVEAGLDLLERHPELPGLYLRLAAACQSAGTVDACRASLGAIQPPGARAALYREAALVQLGDPAQAPAGWKRIAGSAALDAALARLVVDQARSNPDSSWVPEAEAVWQTALARDSSLAGAAFGLGYAAVLRNAWDEGERLLRHATTLDPDDPHPYRELGRIYFLTGRLEPFEAALDRGIRGARARFDLEQELIMRGNLGMAMLQWKGDYERAGALFEEALAQSRFLGDRRTEAFNLYRLGTVRTNQNRYTEALVLLDSASVLFAEQAPAQRPDVLAQRGMALTRMCRFSDAEAALEEAVREAEQQQNQVARQLGLIYLAQLRYNMGAYSAARAVALDVLEQAPQFGFTEYEVTARIVLGDVERIGGSYDNAEVHYREGLALAERVQNVAKARVLYQSLGHVALLRQDANAARTSFERMIERTDQGTASHDLVQAYLGMGYTYEQFGSYGEAVRLYDLALAKVPEGSEETRVRIEILRSKASALAELGRYDEALPLFDEARRLAVASESGPSEYDVELSMGRMYLQQGQYQDALRRFVRAEELEDELQWSAVHWVVLYGKAVAYWRLKDARAAEQAFREAISVIETLRDNLSSTESRALFVQDKVQVYKNFSAFLEEQGRSKEAFHFNERARSRSLVDLLYSTQQGRTLDPNSPADRAIELNRRVRLLEQELEQAAGGGSGEAAAYRSNRAAYLRRERLRADSLYRQVEVDLYGENQLYTFNPLQADTVQKMLKAGEAMVVYNLRPASSGGDAASVAYVVLSDTVLVRRLDVDPRELGETIRFFRDKISASNRGPGSGWEPASKRLYAELVAPVRALLPASVRHLHLVPEGMLHYLPFGALQDERGRFLVEQYTLSVVPSASILKLCREKNPRRWSYMLLLADPDGQLPGARKEVLTIAAGAPNRRHVLVGKDATQKTFQDVAKNYDVIHFATHGNFISRAPWRSHLEMHDGELSVEEIGHLRLGAYLVTLSACETALSGGLASDVPNGDEWVGLNQAFLAAGTPTVMASLWSIDDRVSGTFMSGFYDRLGAGGKAVALAEVQRRFIQDARTHHPFYWAAFTLIGDPL